RRLSVAWACGFVLAPGAIGLKPSIPVLFGAQALAGLSELLVCVAGQTYATSLSTGREREQHLGWYTTMVSAGQLVGPLLGGVLADAVGYARSFLTASVWAFCPSWWAPGFGTCPGRPARSPKRVRRALR